MNYSGIRDFVRQHLDHHTRRMLREYVEKLHAENLRGILNNANTDADVKQIVDDEAQRLTRIIEAGQLAPK